jgi:hypothetical protein
MWKFQILREQASWSTELITVPLELRADSVSLLWQLWMGGKMKGMKLEGFAASSGIAVHWNGSFIHHIKAKAEQLLNILLQNIEESCISQLESCINRCAIQNAVQKQFQLKLPSTVYKLSCRGSILDRKITLVQTYINSSGKIFFRIRIMFIFSTNQVTEDLV